MPVIGQFSDEQLDQLNESVPSVDRARPEVDRMLQERHERRILTGLYEHQKTQGVAEEDKPLFIKAWGSAMGFDMRNRSADDAVQFLAGHKDTEDAFVRVSDSLKKLHGEEGVHPLFKMDEGLAQQEAINTENQRRAGSYERRGLLEEGTNAPVLSLAPVVKEDPFQVGLAVNVAKEKAFWESPKLIYDSFEGRMSPEAKQAVAKSIFYKNPAKAMVALDPLVEQMDSEQLRMFSAVAVAARPELKKNFTERFGLTFEKVFQRRAENAKYFVRSLALGDSATPSGLYTAANEIFGEGGLEEYLDKPDEAGAKKFASLKARVEGDSSIYLGQEFGSVSSRAINDEDVIGLYKAGKQQIAWEKRYNTVSSMAQDKYKKLPTVQEYMLGGHDVVVDMVSLAALTYAGNMVAPGVGTGFAIGATWMDHQAEMERKLIYDHGMKPLDAKLWTGIAAAPYAALEYAKLKGFSDFGLRGLEVANRSVNRSIPHLFMTYFPQYMKRVGVGTVKETGAEVMQGAVDFALMESVRNVYQTEGMSFDQNAKDFWDNAVGAVKYMWMAGLVGGHVTGTMQGAVDMARGGGVRGFFAPEVKMAVRDRTIPLEEFEAEVGMRRAQVDAARLRKESGFKDGVPKNVLDLVRQARAADEAVSSGNQISDVNTEVDVEAEIAALGYENPAAVVEASHAELDVQDKTRAVIQAKVNTLDRMMEAERGQEEFVVPKNGAKFGMVEMAMGGWAAGMDLTLDVVKTPKEFTEKYGVGAGVAVKAANMRKTDGGWQVVLVDSMLKNNSDAYTQFRHEVLGHVGFDLSKNGPEIVGRVMGLVGTDYIKSRLPQYAALHEAGKLTDAGLVQEYLAVLAGDLRLASVSEADKGMLAKLKEGFVRSLGVESTSVMTAREVLDMARDVMGEAFKAGTMQKNDNSGSQRAYDEQQKNAGKDLKRRVAAADKQIQQMADGNPVIGMVLREGGVQMPEDKEKSWPDEYKAIPKRFRGKKGAGLPLDELTDQAASLKGITADYSTSEFRAELEAFDAKAERILADAARGSGSMDQGASEAELVRQVEAKEITPEEFDRAMAELTGARFSVAGMDMSKEQANDRLDYLNLKIKTPSSFRVSKQDRPDLNAIERKNIARKEFEKWRSVPDNQAALNEYSRMADYIRELIEKEKTAKFLAWPGNKKTAAEIEKQIKSSGIEYYRVNALTGSVYFILPDKTKLRIADHKTPPGGAFDVERQQHMREAEYDSNPFSDETPEEIATQFIEYAKNEEAINGAFLSSESLRRTEAQNLNRSQGSVVDGGQNGTISGAEGQARFSVAPPTGSAAFKKWFGDSKVVDEEGKPLVVYHGTAENFNTFKSSGVTYFTDSSRLASDYAQDAEQNAYFAEQRANVMPVYLAMQNPLILDSSDGSLDVGLQDGKLVKQAKEGGNDGVIIKNQRDNIVLGDSERHTVYIAFREEQIKSATGNAGTFDGSNPDIRFSVEEMATDGPVKFNELLADPRYSIAWASDRWNDAKRQEIAFESQRVRVYKVIREGAEIYETQIKKSGKWATVQYADNLEEAKTTEPQVNGFYSTLADYIQAKKTSGKEWYAEQVAAGLSDNDIFGLVDGVDPAAVRINFIPPPTYGEVSAQSGQSAERYPVFQSNNNQEQLLDAEGNPRFSVEQQEDQRRAVVITLASEIIKEQERGAKRSAVTPSKVQDALVSVGVRADKAIAAEDLARAKEIVGLVRAQRSMGGDLNRLISQAEIDTHYGRQLEEAHKMGERGGRIWQQAQDEVDRLRGERRKFARALSVGLTSSELDDKSHIDLENLWKKLIIEERVRKPRQAQETEKQYGERPVGTPLPDDLKLDITKDEYALEIRDWLYEVRRSVYRQLMFNKAPVPGSFQKAWSDPIVKAAYMQTVENLLREKVQDLTFGPSRARLEQRIDGLSSRKQLDSYENAVAGILDEMFNTAVDQNRQEWIEQAWKELERVSGAIKSRQSKYARQLSGRAELMFRDIKSVMALDDESLNVEINATIDQLSGESSVEHQQELRDRLSVLNRFGGLQYKKVGEIAEAVTWLHDTMADELHKQQEIIERRIQQAKGWKETILESLPKKRIAPEGVKGSVRNMFTRAMPVKLRLNDLVRYGVPAAAKKAKAQVTEYASQLSDANTRKEIEENRALAWMKQTLQDLYKTDDAGAVWHDLIRSRDEFIEYSDDGLPMSKTQLMQLVATFAQADYAKRAQMVLKYEATISALAQEMGISLADMKGTKAVAYAGMDITKELARREKLDPFQTAQLIYAAVEEGSRLGRQYNSALKILKNEVLSDQDLELIRKLRQFYAQGRGPLSAVLEDITGLPIPGNMDPNYVPVKKQYERGGMNGGGQKMPVTPAGLSRRVENFRSFDETADMLSLWHNRMQENAQFKHFGKLHQDLGVLFNDPDVLHKARVVHGEAFVKGLVDHLTDIMSGKPATVKSDSAGATLVNLKAFTALGFNLSLFPRQWVGGLPSFGYFCTAEEMSGYIADLTSEEGRAAFTMILNSEWAKSRRQKGNTQILNESMAKIDKFKVLRKYKEFAMMPTMWGDSFSIATFGQGYYRAQRVEAARRGIETEEKIHEFAMNRLWEISNLSQQSGAVLNRSEWQRSGNWADRAFGMFTSGPQQQMSFQVDAYRDWKAIKDSGDVERIAAAKRHLMKVGFINHVLVPLGYNGIKIIVNSFLKAGFGEDDAKEMLVSMLMGPFGGLYIGGTVLQQFVESVVLGKQFYKSDLTPVSSVLQDVELLGLAARAVATMEFSELPTIFDDAMRNNFAPYRDIKKLKEGWFE